MRGVIAGVVAALCAAVSAWWFWPEGVTRQNVAPSKKGLIKEVAPAATNKTPDIVAEKEDRDSLEWLKKHDPRYIVPADAVRRPNGRLYTQNGRRILEDKPARKLVADPDYKPIFIHQAETQISRLLSIEPGSVFIGNGNYGPKFIESFKQSIIEPTLITKDDDDDTRALKRQVNEVKADLKERMDSGEDIREIMINTEQELRSLATFRENMREELIALRFDENISAEDYNDYIRAANKMLEERGMKGLTSPKFAESQLKYLRESRKARLAKKAAKESAQSLKEE